jgi:hypothetical protein
VRLAPGEARQLADGGRVHVRVVAHEQLHAHARRRARLAQLVVRRRRRRCKLTRLLSNLDYPLLSLPTFLHIHQNNDVTFFLLPLSH